MFIILIRKLGIDFNVMVPKVKELGAQRGEKQHLSSFRTKSCVLVFQLF